MKLIFAIVNSDDSSAVSAAMTRGGYFVTKLASTGGFLMSGNTTFLICTEEEKIDQAISIIGEHSRKRKQLVSSSVNFGLNTYTALPVEVTVGGATIIVTDVERFEKI